MKERYLVRLWDRLARHLVPEPLALHPVSLTLETGIRVCCNSEQTLIVFAELFCDQTYRKAVDLAKPVSNVVDLGGNRGLFVLYVEHHLRELKRADRPRYLCVEPSEANVRSLERHIHENGMIDRVRIARGAVTGRRNGSIDFYYAGRSNTSAAIVRKAGFTTHRVPIVDLGKLSNSPIDLLKIDIEGSEEEFLREYADVLARTRVIAIELHAPLVDADACRRMLSAGGFTLAEVTSSRQAHMVTEIYHRCGA